MSDTKDPALASTVIPHGVTTEGEVEIGIGVTFAGSNIKLRRGVRIDAAAVVADGVTIGQNAWLRAGAVALRDVPPNAIVEGNPAQVIGYQTDIAAGHQATPHIDINDVKHLDRPAVFPLGVGESALYLMRRVEDPRGALTVGEVPSEVPFTPQRYFTVFNVPSEELRGEHAHIKCQQFLTCLHGSCRILLDDGQSRCEVTLDRPDIGVFMPEMIWGTQYKYSSDAVLLVFASRPYEADDYLRTYDDFTAKLAETK